MTNDVQDPLVRDPWSVSPDDMASTATFDQSWFTDALREGGFLLAETPPTDTPTVGTEDTDQDPAATVPSPVASDIDEPAAASTPWHAEETPEPATVSMVSGIDGTSEPDPASTASSMDATVEPAPVPASDLTPTAAPVDSPLVSTSTTAAIPSAEAPVAQRHDPVAPAWPRMTLPPVAAPPTPIEVTAPSTRAMVTPSTLPADRPPTPPASLSTRIAARRASVVAAPAVSPGAAPAPHAPSTTSAPPVPFASSVSAPATPDIAGASSPPALEGPAGPTAPTTTSQPPTPAAFLLRGAVTPPVDQVTTTPESLDVPAGTTSPDDATTAAVLEPRDMWDRLETIDGPAEDDVVDADLVVDTELVVDTDTHLDASPVDIEDLSTPSWPTPAEDASAWVMAPPDATDDEALESTEWRLVLEPDAGSTLTSTGTTDVGADATASPDAMWAADFHDPGVTDLDAANAEADAVEAALFEATDLDRSIDGDMADVDPAHGDDTTVRLAALGLMDTVASPAPALEPGLAEPAASPTSAGRTDPTAPMVLAEPPADRDPMAPAASRDERLAAAFPGLTASPVGSAATLERGPVGGAEPEASEGELWALVGTAAGPGQATTVPRATRAATLVLTALVALVIVVLVIGFVVLLGQLV